MFYYLVLLFTVIPAIELLILIEVGTRIGAGNTLMLIVLTGVMGAYLARLQGFSILQKIQSNMNQGVMPTEEMLDGVMILVGGIVLLTPGFVTDTLGFLLLIPWSRALIKLWIRKYMTSMIDRGEVTSIRTGDPRRRFQNDAEDADFYE